MVEAVCSQRSLHHLTSSQDIDLSEQKRVILLRRPVGVPTDDDFGWEDIEPVPLENGDVRVAVRYVSLDPAMRGWMSDLPSYMPPVRLGDVMRSFGVGEVVESADSSMEVGTLVSGMTGVQTQWVTSGRKVTRLPKTNLPLSAFVGPVGIPGLSAYFGLFGRWTTEGWTDGIGFWCSWCSRLHCGSNWKD